MFSISKKALFSTIVVCILISLVAACQAQPNQGKSVLEVTSGSESDQATSTLEVSSGREPNAWVSGSVTYR